jgi:hypothetical protein
VDDHITNYSQEDLNQLLRSHGYENAQVDLKIFSDSHQDRFLRIKSQQDGKVRFSYVSLKCIEPNQNWLHHSLDMGQDFSIDVCVEEDTGQVRHADGIAEVLTERFLIPKGESFTILVACQKRADGHNKRKEWDLIVSYIGVPFIRLLLDCV